MTSSTAEVIQQVHIQEGSLVEQVNVNTGEVRKDWNSDRLDKSDSGMEESFQNSTDSHDESGDEDEKIGNRKSRVKKRMILEDSDEESDAGDMQESVNVEEMQHEKTQDEHETTASLVCKNTASSHNDSDSNEDDDDEDRLVLQIDENEESEDENAAAAEDESGGTDKLSRDFDEVLESEICLKNTELFDAEDSDEDKKAPSLEEEGSQEFEHSGDRQDQENDDTAERYEEGMGDDDEGFDESQLDPKLLAKLKKMKGASKTPQEREKKSRKSKTNAEQMMDIHSESQRLMRESRVNLPYYEPEKKSLDDFLARAEKKKLEYSALRRPKDIQKAQIIHEKLSVRPPVYPSPSRKKSSSQDKDQSESVNSPAKEMQEEVGLEDSGVMSQGGGNASQTSTVVLDNSQPVSSCPIIASMEENELPDLDASSSTRRIMDEVLSRITEPSSEKNTVSVASPLQETECALSVEHALAVELPPMDVRDFDIVNECTGTEAPKLLSGVPSLKRDQSRDLFRSQSTIGDEKESATGIQASNPDVCMEHQEEASTNHVIGESALADTENSCGVSTKTIVQETPLSDCTNTELNTQEDSEQVTAECEQATKSPKTPKQKLLQKLQLQGLALPELPKLSGAQDTVICLDDDEAKPKKQPEFAKLMNRLVQHTRKKVVKPAYDVDISIVEKEGQDGEVKELTLKSLKYHVGEEVLDSSQSERTPGSKLLVLKKQLGVGMKQKRQEARQRRQQIYALENEEGYEENKEDDADEEEEEAEMTEGSDTDDEEEEDPEEDGFELQYGNLDDSDDGRDYNPLMDTEAKDDDDDDGDDEEDEDEDSNDVHLHFDVSDEEEEEDEEEKLEDRNDGDDESEENNNDDRKMTVLKKKKKKAKSSNRLFSDDEEDEDEDEDEERESLSSSQPWKNRCRPEKSSEFKHVGIKDSLGSVDQWADDLTPMTRHLQDTQITSPDLYGPSTHEESESNSGRIGESLNDSSQSMGFFNPASQLLDADGYLRMTQTQKPKSRIAMLANVEDDNTARDSFDSSLKMSVGKIFAGSSGQVAEEDDNMRELMGLCSGTFGPGHDSDEEIRPSQNGLPNTQSFKVPEASDEENLFNILSADEEEEDEPDRRKRVKRVLSDSEEEEEKDDDDGADTDELDEEKEESSEKFTGFKDKKKGIRKEFLDVEAELSGSEFDSDENLDLAEEDDILEEEEGDQDMAGVSNEVLRDQVGRVHMKQLQDQDDRDVMRFKEMYLQDGDLYSEGGGRMRNFRWKNIDEGSQQDVFAGHSDEEQGEEEEDAEEIRWRKERYEREKFLLESQNEDKASENELLKFGQLFVKRKDSVSDEVTQTSIPTRSDASAPFVEPHKPSIKKKGSFLSRSKDALNKLAQAAKSALGNSSTRNSRNFVFQSLSTQEDQEGNVVTPQAQPLQPPKRKAHSIDAAQQAAKKQKTASDTPVRPLVRRQSSIFNLLEK